MTTLTFRETPHGYVDADGPANDNARVLIIHAAMDGCVITDARGRVVFGPTTASIAARKRAELEAAS